MVTFYRCRHCGNVIIKLHDSHVPVVCCKEEMAILTANTEEASFEKHIPIIRGTETVTEILIGETLHPMTEDHAIEWIYVETRQGGYIHNLKPTDEPKIQTVMKQDDILAVYSYCNLHGLWQMKKS